MIPAPTLEDVRQAALHGFQHRYQAGSSSLVRMLGILFAPPHHSRVQEDILPAMRYFHLRSGDNIDFFWAGYSAYGFDDERDRERVVKLPVESDDDVPRYFSPYKFDVFRRQLQRHANWEYSGNPELLLLNSEYLSQFNDARLDFSSAMALDLERGIRDGVIGNIPELFEKIFSYAERQDGCDPTWGFGLVAGSQWRGRVLFRFVQSLFHLDALPVIDNSLYFRSVDLTQRSG